MAAYMRHVRHSAGLFRGSRHVEDELRALLLTDQCLQNISEGVYAHFQQLVQDGSLHHEFEIQVSNCYGFHNIAQYGMYYHEKEDQQMDSKLPLLPTDLRTWLREQGLHSCCSRPVITVIRALPVKKQQRLDRLTACQHLLQRSVVCGVLPARWNSTQPPTPTAATDILSQDLPAGYIPEPPPIPVPELPVELPLNALGEPTLQALGLAKWTPPGLVQTALEHMYVGFDLPWWGAIMAGTVVLRLCIFPLVILAQRNAAQMHNHMPTVQRLQQKFTKSRASGNVLEAARVATELQDYMKRNEVRPGRGMLVPLAQVPIFLSVFVGVRAMANLPVESMKMGGLLWFTDLTVPDPYYLLPLITMSTLLITLEASASMCILGKVPGNIDGSAQLDLVQGHYEQLGVDGVRAQSMSHTIKWVMRAMPIIIFPFVLNFPAAMLCYWVSTNGFSLIQVMVLKIPSVREFFKIPPLVMHTEATKGPKKGFVEGFKETWSNSKVMAELEDRHRTDAARWKQAGEGPLIKTYKHDPTKTALRAKSK